MLLDKNARNHIKFFQDKEYYPFPEDEADRIRECEKLFSYLTDPIFCHKHKIKGYCIAVYELDNLFYLTSCVKYPGDDIYVTTVYILPDKNDAMAIAKFADKNLGEVGKMYKQQILDGVREYGKRTNQTEASNN